jgi:Flp pilus assembly protein TadD
MIYRMVMPCPLSMKASTTRRSMLVLIGLVVLVVVSPGRIEGQKGPPPAPADSADLHLGKGYEAMKQENYAAAAEEFRAALNLDPKLVLKAQFPLAVALFEMHKSVEARQEFDAVRKEAGDHPNVLYYLGRLDLEERNFTSAVENLRKAAAKPPFPDTAYYLGFAYFKQGNLPAAERWLKEAARLTPRDSRVPYQLGQVYRKQGHTAEAEKELAFSAELRRRDTHESQLKLECAQKLGSGQRDEARNVCEKLYDPDNAETLTALGTVYGQHGEMEWALKPLRRAAELAPQSPQMQYNLALVYYQLNQFENARAPLVNALKRWPDLFQLNSLYASVLLKLGEDVPACEALRHAHELNPKDSETENLLYAMTLGLGHKRQHERQYAESLRHFQEAARLRPSEAEPHRHMAEIYKRTGREDEATDEQRQADRLARNLVKPE